MQYFFRKYQFPSEDFYRGVLSRTEVYIQSTVTELGILVEDYYSVDALWYNQIPEEWIPYEIWDIEGNGAHTYLGWDFHNNTVEEWQ